MTQNAPLELTKALIDSGAVKDWENAQKAYVAFTLMCLDTNAQRMDYENHLKQKYLLEKH